MPRFPVLLTAGATVVALTGCPSDPNHTRSALLPHHQPVLSGRQPMGSSRQEVEFGMPTALQTAPPDLPPHQEHSGDPGRNAVATRHASGAWRLRLPRRIHGSIGARWDHGIEAEGLQVHRDKRNVFGGGLTFQSAVPLAPRFRVGLGTELMGYSIPYQSWYSRCVDPECMRTEDVVRRDRRGVPVLGVGITPSVRALSAISVFAGFTARSHPRIDESGSTNQSGDDPARVLPGGLSFSATLGVDLHLPGGIRSTVFVYQAQENFGYHSEHGGYSPTLGMSLTVPLHRD